MPNVAIVTDSCASVPEALIDALRDWWVPCYVHRGQEVLRDLVTVQREAFYRWLPTAKERRVVGGRTLPGAWGAHRAGHRRGVLPTGRPVEKVHTGTPVPVRR